MKLLFPAHAAVMAALLGSIVFTSTLAIAAPADTLSATQIRNLLRKQGYTALTDFELEHGVWNVDALNAQGQHVEVLVDASSGRILSDGGTPHALSAAQIQQQLQRAGYRRVHDLELDDGVWKADAYTSAGMPVELTLDARTGKLLHSENALFD